MSKKELMEYAEWFHHVVPERMRELESAVQSTIGFEGWKPDYSELSLDLLGTWFAGEIETRSRTREERDTINARSPYPIETPSWELTDRTLSLCMDIGMYLSQVLLRKFPTLKWEQAIRSKKFIDYGQPILVGFRGDVPLNPVHIVITMAYGFASRAKSVKSLYDIFVIWSGMVK